MRAFTLDSFDTQPALRDDLAAPTPADDDYLRDLGVSDRVDRNGDVASAVRKVHPEGVDAILDVVSQAPDAALLKTNGRLASPIGAAGEGPRRCNIMAQPTPANLVRLAGLLESGALRVPIQGTYPLEQAAEALQALSATHSQGKLSLTIA